MVLAFPTGRLERFPERAFVAVGYVTALFVHLFGMALGGFGPDNLLTFASRESASHRLLNAELIVLSALCVAGIGVLRSEDETPAPRCAARSRSSSKRSRLRSS